MPRFFIDLHDGANFLQDSEGFELPDAEAAREKLVRIMSKIAQEFPSASERQDYLGVVRDAEKQVIFRGHLSLDIERVEAS